MRVMTSVEAQNHFGLLLDTAQREPVTITRRGRPVAYLLSPQNYEEMRAGTVARAGVPSASELLAAFRGSGTGGSVTRLVADRESDCLSEL